MTPLLAGAFAVTTAVATLVGLCVLLLPWRRPVSWHRVAVAALAVVLVDTLAVSVLYHLGLDAFGVIRIAWLDVRVVVPACGAAVVASALLGRAVRRGVLLLGIGGLALLLVAHHAERVAPFDWRLEEVVVPLDPGRAGRSPLTVGLLSDIQTDRVTDVERAAVAALVAREPDIVLVAGDVYQGPADALDAVVDDFRALFAQLHAPGGVWVVPGNAERLADLERVLHGTEARLLRDEVVHVAVRDRRVTLFGVDETDYDDELSRDYAAGEPSAALAAFAARPGDDDVRLVLSHRPRVVQALGAEARVDLVVAGHTHGGQVSFPLVGPPIVLSPLPRRVAAGGLHELGGHALYVSRGLGMERGQAPLIRFGVPPEVTLLTLATPAGAPPPSGVIEACDAPESFRPPQGQATMTPAPGARGGALSFRFPRKSSNDYAIGSSSGDPTWDAADGFSFLLRGDGSAHCGVLELPWSDGEVRYDYAFPLDVAGWHRVVVPWRALVPQGATAEVRPLGPGGNAPSLLRAIRFGRPGYWPDEQAFSFTVDDIRLEWDLPDAPPPAAPPGDPLGRVRSKLLAGEPVTIVVMGDSFADPTRQTNREGAWPELLAAELRAATGAGVELVNTAIRGHQLRHGMAMIPTWLPRAPRPDLLLVAYGVNEASIQSEPALYEAALLEAVALVRRATDGAADVGLVTPAPAPLLETELAGMAEATRRAAAACGAGVVDVYAVLAELPYADRCALFDPGELRTARAKARTIEDAEGLRLRVVHPGPPGARAYAEIIAAELLPERHTTR